MPTQNDEIDYKAELWSVRRTYISATPTQRLLTARRRLKDHDFEPYPFGPNRLVTSVSAVEGFARCLLQHHRAQSKDDLRKVYPKYKNWQPTRLVKEYLTERGVNDLTTFFAEDNWRLFAYAVEFRNIVVHECTYLGLDKSPALIRACDAVLQKLIEFVTEPPRAISENDSAQQSAGDPDLIGLS